MANFEYTRPGGIWALGTDVLASELADLDEKTVKAPNFAEGGTYSPTDPIIVGGAGFQIEGPFDVDYLARFYQNVQVSGLLQVFGGVNASGGFSLNGTDVNLSASNQLGLYGNVVIAGFGGSLTVQTASTFQENVTFAGRVSITGANSGNTAALSVSQSVSIGGTISVTGTAELKGQFSLGSGFGVGVLNIPLTCANYGRVCERGTFGASTVASYNPRTVQWVVVAQGSLTEAVRYQIDDTGCVNGDHLHVTNHSEYAVGIQNPGGIFITVCLPGTWAYFRRLNGSWILAAKGSLS